MDTLITSYTINFQLDNSYLVDYNNYFPSIKLLTCHQNDNIDEYILDTERMHKLFATKNRIDNYYNVGGWDTLKKRTNPFEMIYLTNKKQRSQSISKYDPLSRSYFKMIEMGHEFLQNHLTKTKPITTAHLAEGPGGFIEGICNIRDNPLDNIYGMTLVSHNREVPGWHRSWYFLSKHPNVNILKGLDNTGNLYNVDNHIFMEYRIANKAELITADGGFDFSVNYNQQEFQAQRLIFSQVILAIAIQEKGGSFICKFFDTYSYISNQIIFLLQCLYTNITIFKPWTSRPANSERYLICQGFKGISARNIAILRHTLTTWNKLPKGIKMKSLFDYMPPKFIQQMKNINQAIQNEQTKYINATINLMENPTKNNIPYTYTNQQQIELARIWCKKYNVPYT